MTLNKSVRGRFELHGGPGVSSQRVGWSCQKPVCMGVSEPPERELNLSKGEVKEQTRMNPVRTHFHEWKNHLVREGGCAQERTLGVKTRRLDFTRSPSWRTPERRVRHFLQLLLSVPHRWQVCWPCEEMGVAGEGGCLLLRWFPGCL